MSTAQRRDLQMNIPALRKLDAMLIVSAISLLCISNGNMQKTSRIHLRIGNQSADTDTEGRHPILTAYIFTVTRINGRN